MDGKKWIKMQGEVTFGVRVDGIDPKRMTKYGLVINIGSYGKTKHKKPGNIKIGYEKALLENEYPEGKIPPLVEDLLNIALATFSADKIVNRSILIGSKQKENRYFTRKINLVVPVSNKEIWESAKHQLEKAISYMTYDLIRFTFITRKSEEIDQKFSKSGYDSIALFSGGLDSLAGSYWLKGHGHRPIFVSINHARIGPYLEKLYKVLPKDSTREIRVKSRNLGSESTQFSRSFVYLSFAVAYALAHKNINKIFIPENGIIARQIGLKDGRHGTKTAHPQFLSYYNILTNTLFPNRDIMIENPFSYKTKTEVVQEIINKDKIRGAISCGHTYDLSLIKKSEWKSAKPTHCGMCIPCLIRTISLISANVPDADKILKVYFNPFSDIDFSNPGRMVTSNSIVLQRRYRDGLVNILDIIRLALEIKSRSLDDLIIDYPEFIDKQVFKLYQRFSENILNTVEHYKKINPSLEDVINKFTS